MWNSILSKKYVIFAFNNNTYMNYVAGLIYIKSISEYTKCQYTVT